MKREKGDEKEKKTCTRKNMKKKEKYIKNIGKKLQKRKRYCNRGKEKKIEEKKTMLRKNKPEFFLRNCQLYRLFHFVTHALNILIVC